MKKTPLYITLCALVAVSFLLVRCNSSSNSGTNSTTAASLPGTWAITSVKCKQLPVNHQSGNLCWKSVVNAMGSVNTSGYFSGYATFTQPSTIQLAASVSNNNIFALLSCLANSASSISANGSYQTIGSDSLFITLSEYNGASINQKYSTFPATYVITGNTMTVELYLSYSEQWELVFTKSA